MEELAQEQAAEDDRELGEDRAKNTDEVAEASDDPSEDAEMHGGDGNSGEVDAPAETSSVDERQGDSPEDGESDGENGGEEGQGEAGDGETQAEASESDGEGNGDWPTFSYDGDASELENFFRFLEYIEAVVEKQQEVSVEDALAEDEAELNVDFTAFEAKGSHGGVHASFESLKERAQWCDPKDIADIKRQLGRMFNAFNDIAGDEQSPRISGKKLVTELVAKRYNLARARREELQPGVKLLMVDVSGSCSAASQEVLAAAAELAEVDPQIVIILHSNGHPEEVYGQAAAGVDSADWYEHAHDLNFVWWTDLIERCNIIGVVSWGDWDAGFILEKLAEVAQLAWFDSYGASQGVKPACKALREGAGGVYSRNGDPSSGWKEQPVSWWQGVNNAATTAIALRRAVKEMRN
jgi:hypothetical protein